MKIAILYICTGEYVAFWKDFYCSFELNFLPDDTKDYFVFTDSDTIYDEMENNRIHRIFQENLGWPGSTLFRFKMFSRITEQLKIFDYIFFMNANVVCMKEITREMFLPIDYELLVVQHPGYYNKERYEFPYERRKKSTAYIPYRDGRVYVCGGINGGKAEAYLRLIKELDQKIQDDYKRGVIAVWHDESQLNRYIVNNINYRLLSPAFCYPEGWRIPFEICFMVSDKSKKIELDSRKVRRQKRRKFAGVKRRVIGIFMELGRKWFRQSIGRRY